jgi:hypothetical protein
MGYTFFNLAQDVLKQSNTPLSVQEIWKKANELGLVEKLSSSGKTPINTLSARLSVDVKHNNKPTFKKVSEKPSRYILNDGIFEMVNNSSSNIYSIGKPSKSTQIKLKERDLHIILSSYVRANEHFGCLTKTIYHEVSKKRKIGINKWLHPDIVGVHFPFESYTENTLKLFDVLKVNPYKLYSFEIKKELNFSNLREYYFQAVSNSSWAHEGYLVALDFSDDVDLLDEIRRLNNAFGIGVIRLNKEHFMQSEILFSAKERDTLDWDTVNRLVAENPDFRDFLDDLMEDITVGKVKSTYDKIFTDEEEAQKYFKELQKKQ